MFQQIPRDNTVPLPEDITLPRAVAKSTSIYTISIVSTVGNTSSSVVKFLTSL